MITKEQAQEVLAAAGVALPSFLLDMILARISAIQACLDEHYDAATAGLIVVAILSLLGLAQGDKYISSQTGPNGASRSFRYQSMRDRWSAQLNLLRNLDKFNCAGELIPEDPFSKGAGLWISTSGCTK